MRKANKQSTTLLPQERFLNLLNDMADRGWHPFGLYGRTYNFSHSYNPEFPYRLSYSKHERAYRIDLADYIIFSTESGLIAELLENHMLDLDKFYDDLEPSIETNYEDFPGHEDFYEDNPFTRCYYLQHQFNSSDRLDKLFEYLIED